jgi:formylglycine-generating enzyme required for sulfatase activity
MYFLVARRGIPMQRSRSVRHLRVALLSLALAMPGANAAEHDARAGASAKTDPALTLAPGSGASFQDVLVDGQPCQACPELVVAPAGQFTMGSPDEEVERLGGETLVAVSIARPFAVGRFAVTFDQWEACVAEGGCNDYQPGHMGWGRGNRPVIGVSWDDAKAYTGWLSAKTGRGYRLLTDAEREYVARAGTTTAFWWGASISPEQANFNGNYAYLGGGTKGEYRKRTLPVDSFAANAWGLYQVHGNVWEWTEDCWIESNTGNPGDGSARTSPDCGRHVVRGGSFYNIPSWIRSARRHWFPTVIRNPVIGFRVARALEP